MASEAKKDEAVVTVDLNKLLVPMAIIIAGAMIAGVIYFSNNGNSGNTDDTSPSVQGAVDDGGGDEGELFEAASTNIDDDAVKGNKDTAKVAIVEFSDFECPFCQRHFQETYPDIVSNYVDTGDVIYVFRDYPLGFHPQAIPAAVAANCAREQGGDDAYWEYHDTLFEGDVASANRDQYIAWAKENGLNEGDFGSCIDSDKYEGEIDQDLNDGSAAGVSGTPGFVIGVLDEDGNVTGKRIAGAYPYSDFEAIINEYLE